MSLVVYDRIQQTGSANTTVSFTLSGTTAGYQSFAVVGNGNTTYYSANDGTNWEVGIGTYSTTGPTLTRTTILSSSNSNNAVSTFGASVTIFCDYPAEKAVMQDASGYLTAGGNYYTNYNPLSSAPTANTGLVWYDSSKDSLSYYNSSGYEVNIGQQVDQVCYNNTGSTIPAGTAVYLSGGNSGNFPYITPAIATSQSTANMVGITGQSIANGATGIVVILGGIFNYNTTGMTAGQTLYLSYTTAGALTTTQPTSPYYAVRAGFVVTGGSSSGIIFVSVRNIYTLGSNIISPVSFTSFSTTSNTLQLYGYSSGQIADLVDVWTYSGGTKAFAINASGGIYAGTWNAGTIGVSYGGTGLTSVTANQIPYGNGTSALNTSSSFTFDGTTQLAPIQGASNGININSRTISASYSIPAGYSASSTGPITINSGVVVTVPTGSKWVIL